MLPLSWEKFPDLTLFSGHTKKALCSNSRPGITAGPGKTLRWVSAPGLNQQAPGTGGLGLQPTAAGAGLQALCAALGPSLNSLGCSSTRRPETQPHRWAPARARLEGSHGPAWGQRGREGFPGAGHGDPGPLDPEAAVRRGGHGQGLQTWRLWGREAGMKVKLGSLMTSLRWRCPVPLGHL